MAGATRVGEGADGKASIERLCLSPNVEKHFNSKVIKGFVFFVCREQINK